MANNRISTFSGLLIMSSAFWNKHQVGYFFNRHACYRQLERALLMALRRRLFLASLSFVIAWSGRSVVAQQTSSELHVGESTSPVALAELSQPVYPPLSRQAAITGIVDVVVTVDGSGAIKSVEVVSGHALLKDAALQSASHSRFACETCGKTARPTECNTRSISAKVKAVAAQTALRCR